MEVAVGGLKVTHHSLSADLPPFSPGLTVTQGDVIARCTWDRISLLTKFSKSSMLRAVCSTVL